MVFTPHLVHAEFVAQVTSSRGPIQITQERFERFLTDNPSMSPVECLDRLIEFELLAQEAKGAGMDADAFVVSAGKQVMVRKYLKAHFEPDWSSENLPDTLLQQSYDRNKAHFVHPELRVASHIIVTQKNKRPKEPDLDATAKQLADQIYADLLGDPPTSSEEFRSRAGRYSAQVKTLKLEVLGQDLRRFARKGRYDPNFTKPVFETEKQQGILPPFVTRFGYHVVRLERIIPAKNDTFEVVKDKLRNRIVPEVRTMKIIELTDQLAESMPKLNPAPGARGLVNAGPL